MRAGPWVANGSGVDQLLGVRLRSVDVVATSSSNVDLTLNRETSLPLYGGLYAYAGERASSLEIN